MNCINSMTTAGWEVAIREEVGIGLNTNHVHESFVIASVDDYTNRRSDDPRRTGEREMRTRHSATKCKRNQKKYAENRRMSSPVLRVLSDRGRSSAYPTSHIKREFGVAPRPPHVAERMHPQATSAENLTYEPKTPQFQTRGFRRREVQAPPERKLRRPSTSYHNQSKSVIFTKVTALVDHTHMRTK